MRRLIVSVMMLGIVGLLNAQWVEVGDDAVWDAHKLNDIQFFGDVGYISQGGSGGGGVIKTTDRGATWVELSSPADSLDADLDGVEWGSRGAWFNSANHGVSVGNDHQLMTTIDGGDTWSVHDPVDGVVSHINSVHASDSLNWMAIGNQGEIIQSTDGGFTWAMSYKMDKNGRSIHGFDADNWYALKFKNAYQLFKTADGGATWDSLLVESSTTVDTGVVVTSAGNLDWLQVIDENILYVFARKGPSFKTIDGGLHWTLLDSLPSASEDGSITYSRSWFSNENVGFVAGGDGTNGILYYTVDGGADWTRVDIDGSALYNPFIGVAVNDDNDIFVGAWGKVYKHSLVDLLPAGTILAVDDSFTAAPERFSLGQNYPNPFNPTTTINFNLDHTANVSLAVFDLLGREVANLVNGHMNVGRHSVSFDGANVSSGVYFYRLTVDGQSAMRKMLLLK